MAAQFYQLPAQHDEVLWILAVDEQPSRYRYHGAYHEMILPLCYHTAITLDGRIAWVSWLMAMKKQAAPYASFDHAARRQIHRMAKASRGLATDACDSQTWPFHHLESHLLRLQCVRGAIGQG